MKQNQGCVYWITGLSASGKTTLATSLQEKITDSILLDGDTLREVLGARSSSFDRASRLALAFTYSRMCKLLAGQGFTVIIATISLYSEIHSWNREHLPNYIEIFLDVSEDTRRQRDPKKLYAKEEAGIMNNMVGIDIAVDIPFSPAFVFDDTFTVDSMLKSIINQS